MIPCTDQRLERKYVATVACFPGELDSGRLDTRDVTVPFLATVLGALYETLDEGGQWDSIRLEDAVRKRSRSHGVSQLRDLLGEARGLPAEGQVAAARTRLQRMAKARRMREKLVRALAACEELDTHEAKSLAEEAAGEQGNASILHGTIGEAVKAWLENVDAGRDTTLYPRTGLTLLDDKIGGLRPGSLWVLAGRSGCRKSSLMLTAAMWQAQHGMKPGIVSLEDDDSVWGERGAAYFALSPGLKERVYSAPKCMDVDLELSYPIDGDPHEVMECARHLAARGRWPIYVDYLQAATFSAEAKRYDKAVANLARALKLLGRRHRIPVILGSQLTTPKGRENKEPYASDVRESGDVLNIAEILTLHWKTSNEENAPVLGRLAKLKWGPAGQAFTLKTGSNGGVVGAVEGHPKQQSAEGYLS